MNRKKNKHYFETDQKIRNSLLELVGKKQVPTVAEICRKCSINRTTFYLHYVDIIDLLNSIQQDIFKQFMESTKEYGEEVTLMSHRSYQLFVKHVMENKNFYRLFFRLNTEFPLKAEFETAWTNIIKPYFIELGIENEEIMLLRFVAFQAGFTISLRKWVEQDCHISCDQMATILSECISL